MMSIDNAKDFGRVAVVYGGDSDEREVSLSSGAAVQKALQSKGVDAIAWDSAQHSLTDLAQQSFDRVWIALHGPGGEDGALQGALQWLDIPYTGSGVMASAIAMDKVRSKHLFRAAGIPTPNFSVVNSMQDLALLSSDVSFPLIVKPSGQGSSVGMSKVLSPAELGHAVEVALQYGDAVLLEECIEGDEITVSILHDRALPSIRIATPRVFYDYRAKYESNRTEYFCPGTNGEDEEARYAALATAAFTELGCTGWGRVDFMTGADGRPQVLEVNTVPGMTSHSLVPMAASQDGVDFATLCWKILETSFAAPVATARQEVAANGA